MNAMNATIRRALVLAAAGMAALILSLAPSRAQDGPSAEDRLDALLARRQQAVQEYFKSAFKEGMSEEEWQAAYEKRPGLEFIPELEAIALEAKGTDVCASARIACLGIQCEFAKKPEAEKTVDLLMEESLESKALEKLPQTLHYGYMQLAGQERVTRTLEKLLEKSSHRSVKAASLSSLGQIWCSSRASETQKAKGRKCFERLIAEFGDVRLDGRVLKDAATAYLFEMDHLQIGMVAPDFESVDENGTKFKLSDYRGKVVVVDFWGEW